MSQIIPDTDGLELVKERESSMMDGSIPSWISTAVSGGTVTALDASNDGGYLELDPGTASTGDYAKVESFNLVPSAYDAIELSGRVSVTSTNPSDISLTLGFEESGNNNITTSWVHPDFDDQLRGVDGGTATLHDVRVLNDTRQHDFTLLWDTDSGFVTYYLDGFPAGVELMSGFPDPSLTFFGQVTAQYKGGSAAQVKVHRFAVRYYRKPN